MPDTEFATALVLPTDRIAVLSILILDASGSMGRHGDAPQVAVNKNTAGLKADKERRHFASLVTFADTYTINFPLMPIEEVPEFTDYKAGGNTLLYRTVKRVLQSLHNLWKNLTPRQRQMLRIVVTVISDGDDNRSPKRLYPAVLRDFSMVGRQYGWTLQAFGLGIDGKRLARDMGFDLNLAETLDADQQSIAQAVDIHTTRTTTFR